MITDMINNKKLNPVLTELFIRDRKLNISIFLLHNQISEYQKTLDEALHTFLLWKFQIKEKFSEMQ